MNSWRFIIKALEEDFNAFQDAMTRVSKMDGTGIVSPLTPAKSKCFLDSFIEKEEIFRTPPVVPSKYHVVWGSDNFVATHDSSWNQAMLEIGDYCDSNHIAWAYIRVKEGYVNSYEISSLEYSDIGMRYSSTDGYIYEWGL